MMNITFASMPALPLPSFGGSTFWSIILCFVTVCVIWSTIYVIESMKDDVRTLVRKSMKGENPKSVHFGAFASTEVEADRHLQVHVEAWKHANFNRFYCNSFTGWRKRCYERTYRKLEKAEAQKLQAEKAQEEKAHAKARKREQRASSVTSLHARTHANRKQYSR